MADQQQRIAEQNRLCSEKLSKDFCLISCTVMVSRVEDGSFSFGIYRKPTHTNQLLTYISHHPMSVKRSVVKTLFKRLEAIPSDENSKREEHSFLRNVFIANQYPIYILTCPQKPQDPLPIPLKTVCIPYISGVSQRIWRILGQHNNKHPQIHPFPPKVSYSQPREIKSCVLHTTSRLWLPPHWGDRSMSVN